MTRKHLFHPGVVVSTPGVVESVSMLDMQRCLERHLCGDWGDVCKEDREANVAALENGDRILSVYKLREATIWIITEWDRSATTFLLPEEY